MTPGPGQLYDIVIPTVGRESLKQLLDAIAHIDAPGPRRVVVVDDRPQVEDPLDITVSSCTDGRVRWLRSGGRGPAAARNVGWRACSSEWVVFLDDDVIPADGWASDVSADLERAGPEVAGVQGRLACPLPTDDRPIDWERNDAGHAHAYWATADMAYRRWALELVDGFDERFARARREDSDIALRIQRLGLTLMRGRRTTLHPPGPHRSAGPISRQAGIQDDSLMVLLHGIGWRRRAGAPRARGLRNVMTTSAGIGALWSWLRGNRRPILTAIWILSTVQLAHNRMRHGPRGLREKLDMAVTSVVFPPVAVAHWLFGWLRNLPLIRDGDRLGSSPREMLSSPVEAVLFDRDGTLVLDVPYNGDPARVQPMPGARGVVSRLRALGVKVGVVTNQSGVGRGIVTGGEVREVNRRVTELLGPFHTWQVCVHAPDAGCECRKPAPGMVLAAAADLGVAAERCVVIGDIGSDIAAARAAGAGHILVPTSETMPDEIAQAGTLAADLEAAADKLAPFLGGAK